MREENARGWPRIYGPARRQVLGFGAMSAVVGAMAIASIVLSAAALPPGMPSVVLASSVFASLAWISGYLVLVLVRERVELHPDEVVVVRWWGRRHRIRRSEVRGHRTLGIGPYRTYLLELTSGRRIPLGGLWVPDQTFFEWLAPLADLDERDRIRSELALVSIAGERGASGARRVSRAMNVIALALAGWAIVAGPSMWAIAALVAWPLVAVAVLTWGRGRFVVDVDRIGSRPHLVGAILLPGCALAIRALTDFETSGVGGLALAALVVAIVLGGYASLHDGARRARTPLVLAFYLFPHALGTVAEANALLDDTAAEVTPVRVLAKRIVRGSGGGPKLVLEAWGDRECGSVRVPRALYDATDVGDVVCVEGRSGALGAPWLVVRACDLDARDAER